MAIKNLHLSTDEVSQTIDLGDFGFKNPPEGFAEVFAQDVIDVILKRTESGVDVNGKRFAGYSESYKNSLNFQAFGKSDAVNMTLTGEMLGSLDILGVDGSKVTIGLRGVEAAKAYGHISGMEGHPVLEGKAPVRDFFGVGESDIKKIAKAYRPDLSGSADSGISQAVEAGILRLLKELL